jgi:hypothetical protein
MSFSNANSMHQGPLGFTPFASHIIYIQSFGRCFYPKRLTISTFRYKIARIDAT